jgi:toxin YxiD
VPKPQGPFRIKKGQEYDQARQAANNANQSIHRQNPELKGQHIHEIKPVKFGGSPTDPANKIPLSQSQHAAFSRFWQNVLRTVNELLK